MANDENKRMMRCSFCGKPQDRVARLHRRSRCVHLQRVRGDLPRRTGR